MINVFGNGIVARVTCKILDRMGVPYRWYGVARKERPLYQSAPPVMRLSYDSPLAPYINTLEIAIKKYALCHDEIYFKSTPELAELYRAKCGNVSTGNSIDELGRDIHRRIIVDKLIPARTMFSVESTHEFINEVCSPDRVTLWCESMPSLIANYTIDVQEAHAACKSIGISYTTYRTFGPERYETLYTPDASLIPYRSTLTGNTLTIERALWDCDADDLKSDEDYISKVMGCTRIEFVSQNHMMIGKIIDNPPEQNAAIADFYRKLKGIYLIGRMANWRSKYMLDDVPADVLRAVQSQSKWNGIKDRRMK